MKNAINRRTAIKGAAALPLATLPALTASASIEDPTVKAYREYEQAGEDVADADEVIMEFDDDLPSGSIFRDRRYFFSEKDIDAHLTTKYGAAVDTKAIAKEWKTGLRNAIAKRFEAAGQMGYRHILLDRDEKFERYQALYQVFLDSSPTTFEGIILKIEDVRERQKLRSENYRQLDMLVNDIQRFAGIPLTPPAFEPAAQTQSKYPPGTLYFYRHKSDPRTYDECIQAPTDLMLYDEVAPPDYRPLAVCYDV